MDHWICALPGRCRVVDGVVLLLLLVVLLIALIARRRRTAKPEPKSSKMDTGTF